MGSATSSFTPPSHSFGFQCSTLIFCSCGILDQISGKDVDVRVLNEARFWPPFVWNSFESFSSKLHCWCICAWSCALFILSLTHRLDFPAWPQISLVTMDMSSVLDTCLITILSSALLFLFSYCGPAFVSEGTALTVLLSQLPVLIWRITNLASPYQHPQTTQSNYLPFNVPLFLLSLNKQAVLFTLSLLNRFCRFFTHI